MSVGWKNLVAQVVEGEGGVLLGRLEEIGLKGKGRQAGKSVRYIAGGGCAAASQQACGYGK